MRKTADRSSRNMQNMRSAMPGMRRYVGHILLRILYELNAITPVFVLFGMSNQDRTGFSDSEHLLSSQC